MDGYNIMNETENIAFTPNLEASPPFSFYGSVAEGLITVEVVWNYGGGRYYIQIRDDRNDVILYTPLIGSSKDYDINLIHAISASTLIYRSASQTFEITL